MGSGFINDEPEIEWSEIIANAIEKKTITLNKPHFYSVEDIELLIYANTHVSIFIEATDALNYLQKAIASKELKSKYALQYKRVSVMMHKEILYDVTNAERIL